MRRGKTLRTQGAKNVKWMGSLTHDPILESSLALLWVNTYKRWRHLHLLLPTTVLHIDLRAREKFAQPHVCAC